jgi:isoquinoline 1-oxidoreductase beta subunit
MEPMNCTAHVQGDRCEVWAPVQKQTEAQRVAAEVAGLPRERVRIHTTLLGGGFGRRQENDYVAEAVSLSKAAGVPVQVIWTREDDVRHGFYRPAVYNTLAAGLDGAGRPVAWVHRIVGPSIAEWKFARLPGGLDNWLVEGAADLPYAIPNVSVHHEIADVPVPRGFWRSTGASHNTFVTECFFDEVARASARDPYELRRELLHDQPRHLAALDLAAERAGWGRALPEGRFRGIAVVAYADSFVAEVAEVSVSDRGIPTVHRVVCAVDCGPIVNPDIIAAQMEGGVAFGLTAALYGEISLERGRVKQGNFHDYRLLRIGEMPTVEVHLVPSVEKMGAIGDPSVPAVAPAICNAIYAATGRPVRKLPLLPAAG